MKASKKRYDSAMKVIVLVLTLLTVTRVFAADPAPASARKWKDAAEASFVNTNGNSRTQTTSAKDFFSYDFNARTRLEIEGGGLGARSQGQVTAEQYYAGEKTQTKYDEHDYVFEKYRWDKNRFAGVASRQEFSVGVGRELWKNASNLLIGELAPGYLNEERINDKRRSNATVRAYSKYEHAFAPTSKFSQDVEYLQSLADKRDSRINTETALTSTLTSRFSVKTSFVWKRSNQPPAGTRKDDEITSFALIANF
jgi:putative salt-induced outer membrane protein YdiY